MKLTFVICLCLTGLISKAQFKTPESRFKFNSNLTTPANLSRPLNFTPSHSKATVIATNSFGRIYALPKDNMACFVPNVNLIVTMPNAVRYFDNSLMLNPYKKEEIIPQQ